MNQMDKHLKVLLKGLTVGGGGGLYGERVGVEGGKRSHKVLCIHRQLRCVMHVHG